MKEKLIWGGVILALIIAVGFACFRWGVTTAQRDIANAPVTTTESSHPVQIPLPIPTLTPNPAPARVDTIQDTRAIDSLIAVNKDKDTFIRSLLFKRTFQQTWESHTDSTSIVGRLVGVYNPSDFTAKTNVFVDSLTVPERVREIIRTVTVYKTPLEPWIVSVVCVIITVLQMLTK